MAEIRATRSDDIASLQEVLNQTGLFPSDMLPELLAPFLAEATTTVWLTAQIGSDPVGFCFAEPEDMADRTWNMRALGVRPDHQGRGLGSRLVGACEDMLRIRGQRLLIVDTSGGPSFAPARTFYTANGFEEEARLRDFWAPGDDKVTFRKSLV